jgi:hypothetical protein
VQTETSAPDRFSTLTSGWKFLRVKNWAVLCLSALVIVPCWWHRHIEAGDLGSHVYNAWLAQLIGKGQAPGLYLAWQWNNILFDVSLLHTANWVGFTLAEKIVVSLCVLIFFWGVFALASAVSGSVAWALTPGIAMLAYGYSFEMGFMNYYLSIGLACFCLALTWRQADGPSSTSARDWVAALACTALALLAHPLGFVWIVGVLSYRAVRPWTPGCRKLLIPAAEVLAFLGFRWYVHRHDLSVSWTTVMPFYELNGTDQLAVFGRRYEMLTWAALIFVLSWFAVEFVARRREAWPSAGTSAYWKRLALPLELYLLLFCTTAVSPENLRFSIDAGWIGLVVSRLTAITAIVGLALLACTKPRWWQPVGLATIAAVFFVFLYQDTGNLNRMEQNAETLLSTVPIGTRIVPTIFADPDWRVEFVVHLADRACVGRCFVYSNYEPSSRQFRVRVAPGGSPIATDSVDDAEDLQSGTYEIQKSDLPLKQLYQCDEKDWMRLCLRDLAVGDHAGAGVKRPGT